MQFGDGSHRFAAVDPLVTRFYEVNLWQELRKEHIAMLHDAAVHIIRLAWDLFHPDKQALPVIYLLQFDGQGAGFLFIAKRKNTGCQPGLIALGLQVFEMGIDRIIRRTQTDFIRCLCPDEQREEE